MKKLKHNHKGTKLIKLSLFASMMFAPILAVLFKCAYVTFNKNAYQNYSGETTNEYSLENVNENTNLQSTNTFELINNPSNLNPNEYNGATYQLENVEIIYTSSNTTYFTNTCTIRMYHDSAGNKWAVTNDSNQTAYILISNLTCDIKFNFVNNVTQYSTNFVNQIYERNYNKNYFLDNAFEYSINQLEESNLFNWTKEAALYTPTQAMTSGMGIQTDSIAMIITYWMYITAIYIVIDIVVELFTYITHTITGRLETD